MEKKTNHKRKHRALLLIVGALGIILFWRGVWILTDYTPILQDPIISIVFGIVLLILSHQWYREL